MQKTLNFSLSLVVTEGAKETIGILKHGDTVSLGIKILDTENKVMNLTEKTVDLILKKQDSTIYENTVANITTTTELTKGYRPTTYTGSLVTISLDEQATNALGIVQGEIQISDETGTITTNTFTFLVIPSLSDGIIASSENEIQTLVELINTIQEYEELATAISGTITPIEALTEIKSYINTNLPQLETNNASAVTNNTNLQNSITQSQSSKVALDESITNANTFVSEHGNIIDLDSRVTVNTSQIASLASGSPKGVYATLSTLQTAYPTGNTNVYIVNGDIKEVDTLTVITIPTANGNVTITLNGVAFTVALTTAMTTTDSVATAIRGTTFSGWTTSGTGSVVTFTKTTSGINTTPTFSAGTTGSTATIIVTTVGVAADYGWYYWNGSAWIRGGIYQSLGVANNSVSVEKIKNKAISVEKTNFINRGKNLLDEDNVLLNYYMQVDGSLVYSSTYCVTDYIPVLNSEYILLWRNTGEADPRRGIRKVTFFDENYNVLSSYGVDNPSLSPEPILVSGNEITYAKLSFNKGYIDGKSIVEKSQTPTTFEKYYCQIKKIKLSSETLSYLNPLYGKKIMGFGDSIMRGAGNSDVGIVDILGTRNSMTVANNAVSGATILADTTNNIPLQITNATGTTDYIVLDGYINDVLISDILSRLGTISPYFGSAFDTNTFCGQMETMLRSLSTKFIGSKILYVFVHHMNTRDDQVVKQIHSLAKQICAKWSIPVVDLYEDGLLNTYIEGYRSPYTGNSGDGTHPNQLGYDTFYIPQIEAKLKML